ncbi:MAG: transposase family protein [Anaerolineae bacterium]|nr:transposase family protein [Anaerolineae bacterium]MCI0608456.1 transposase family protein [Anaerolineae bacterium]
MTETEPMNVNERRKYLHKMRLRYWQAERKNAKSALLDEMQSVTNLHRKSVIRLIQGDLARKPRRKQRGKTYGADVKWVVEKIAQSLDYPCAERLQPNLVWMANHLEAHKEIELNAEIKTKLERISVSTVRRLLLPSQRASNRIAHSKRQPNASFAQRQAIPVRRIPWQERTPGHFEVDLVHHCGLSASGQYVHTLQMTDVATGWSECVALLGRSYLVMQDGFQRIEKRLPFPILEIHPDNGSEFLNDHLMRFWQQRAQPLELSRSRPYSKNDNRFVEENNFSQVRA